MRRLYLTAREFEALLLRQNGTCCVDDCDESEDLIGEHSTPHAWRRAKPDQLMCSSCHKIKTLRDIKAIWKVKRLNGRVSSQYQRRKRFGAQLPSRPFPSARKPGDGQWKR